MHAGKEFCLTNWITAYVPSLSLPEGGYVRTFEAEIDDHSESAIRVRGVLSDHRCALEHEWVLQTPEYEVMQASARHLHGEPGILSPELIARYPDIRGVRIAAGFTRTTRQALGELPGHQEHLALAIEMARVGQQAYKLPKGYYEQFQPLTVGIPSGPSRLARMAWEQDRHYMPDLCNSCYAFRDESATLFNERTVVSYDPDIMSPDPGQTHIFWRTKRMQITQRPDGLGFHCQNEMDDTVHEIRLAFDMDAGGTVQQAQSQAIRVPYMGICEDAQLKTLELNGQTCTKEFIRLIADRVGGASGCTHLFDLSVDCLRFFIWR
jgi:hypothetical protein